MTRSPYLASLTVSLYNPEIKLSHNHNKYGIIVNYKVNYSKIGILYPNLAAHLCLTGNFKVALIHYGG
jgi:hypothetical protein